VLVAGALACLSAPSDQVIYSDSLQNGWQGWGWTAINYANTAPVHSGSDSISVTVTNPWQAIYLAHAAFDSSPYTNLTFWLNGGAAGGQQLLIQGHAGGSPQATFALPPLAANRWQQFNVSLAALGVANRLDMDGFWIQDRIGAAQPTFYLDDITLVAGTTPPATNTPLAITVDARLNRQPISPLIYGVAFATSSNQLADLNCPIHRSGGNNETRYNWQINAHNLGADWYFESYPDSSATPGQTADTFVANSKGAGAEPMITVPMIGWAPYLGPGRAILYSYSVAKYGPQSSTDPWHPDAGNGQSSTNASAPITWNDPRDANFPTNTAFEETYVQHLLQQWGSSTNGGVRYYILDNEHSLWCSTHQDVHPVGATMDEIWTNMLATASMIKSNDLNALVLGPEEWGWSGYLYSGFDQQWARAHSDWNPARFPDRSAHGGWDYLPWLLSQFHQHDTASGQRLLDYFTLHCYPQENNVSGSDVSAATVLLRNQSTRVFWDSNYVDPSWVNSVMMLIPRMKGWVAANYPGTKAGITEYNWGAETNINGATAQADILGIFGREGLDLATRWTTPATGTPAYNAIKMYRNYDGNKSTFGDTSLSAATAANPDNLSAFAALRTADGALTTMVINKQASAAATVTVTVTNFPGSDAAQFWQLTASNVITRLPDLPLASHTFTSTLPPQSISLFVLPAPTPVRPILRPEPLGAANTFDCWLDGQAGQSYVISWSGDLRTWFPLQTNTLAGTSLHLIMPATNAAARFFRAQWTP